MANVTFDLLTRAVSNVTPADLAKKKLDSGKPLRLYFGIDPTGTKLHLGHSVPLRKMRAFQDAGHEVILVIGSFTAMIGDPTDRDGMRQPLTKEQVKENFSTYIDQAKKILDVRTLQVVYNHEWLEMVNFEKIIELASNFTVQQMLERDMFDARMQKGSPIGVHEFLYPLMVGYDSVMLDVDFELGGNDQYFNMLAGRTLQTAYGKRDKCVLTVRLLEGTDGRKMSKTYDNCIYITDDPNDMFGKVMRVHDSLIAAYMESCTDIPLKEVDAIKKTIEKGEGNPKEHKVRLAKEIVTIYHGKKHADAAAQEFENVFSKKQAPSDMRAIRIGTCKTIVDLIVSEKLVESKSEARRLIEQGAIKLDDQKIDSPDTQPSAGILKIGKRLFVRVLP